ncbi:Ig-like domain-containing protein [Acinetobacter pragensis]|uniref:Ig-like domain-containing protein n=1 Tax=Acinetobacter pragensis TaxID=1806892 RepID=UPI00333F1701
MTEFSSVLAGTADARSWVIVTVEEKQYRIKANAQGNWSIDNPIQNGGVATIYAVNQHGVRSEDTQIAKLPEIILRPNTPEIIEWAQYLSGTADPDNTVIVMHNGQEYRAIADENGNWNMLNPMVSTGTLTITAINAVGVRSDDLVITKIFKLQAPTIIENDEVLSGTGEPNSIIVIKANDTDYRTLVDDLGNWSTENPIARGGTAEIYAMNQYGSTSETIAIAKLVELPIQPSIPSVTESDAVLAGTADPHAIIIIQANDLEYRVIADDSGHWSLDNPIANGGVLSIIAQDQSGHQSPEILLALPFVPVSPEAPQYAIAAPIILANEDILEGQSAPNLKIVIKANGQQFETDANEDGYWKIENPIADGGFAVIYAEDHYGVQSEEISLAKIPVMPLASENDLSDVLTVYADMQVMISNHDQGGQSLIDVDSLLSADRLNEAQSVWLEPNAVLGLDAVLPQQNVQGLSISFEYRSLDLDAVQTAAHWMV